MSLITSDNYRAANFFEKAIGLINSFLGPKTVCLKEAFGKAVDRALKQESFCKRYDIPLSESPNLSHQITLAERLEMQIRTGHDTVQIPRGESLDSAFLGRTYKPQPRPDAEEAMERLCQVAQEPRFLSL